VTGPSRPGPTPAALAAPGTDPDLLVDVVAALCTGEAELRRDVAQRIRVGHEPADALRASVAPRLDRDTVVASSVRAWRASGVRLCLAGDPTYPERLLHLSDPPPLLAVRGDPSALLECPVVALVGSRAATPYGRGVAAWLAESVGDAGVHVVSGGAVGVDGAAHAAAVGRPGGTSVVLGCGHAVPYPRAHASPGGLFDRVAGSGGALLSECLPAAPPRAHRVRARNRLVAGLAHVVVVVEGGARSGSLLTATAASDLGVPVLAVPGDVRAPGSVAPHRLLAEGAGPCTTPTDVLDAVGVVAAPSRSRVDGANVLPTAVHRVLATAWPRPVPVEALARDTGLDVAALMACITRARVAGELAQGPSGVVLRRSPDALAE
jgi:DNA processing protein